jgi:hypothetical protein
MSGWPEGRSSLLTATAGAAEARTGAVVGAAAVVSATAAAATNADGIGAGCGLAAGWLAHAAMAIGATRDVSVR